LLLKAAPIYLHPSGFCPPTNQKRAQFNAVVILNDKNGPCGGV
jgi:hypothetical protein